MRVLATLFVLALALEALSACAVVDAGSAVVSVASTAVGTTATVAGDIICLVCSSDDDKLEQTR